MFSGIAARPWDFDECARRQRKMYESAAHAWEFYEKIIAERYSGLNINWRSAENLPDNRTGSFCRLDWAPGCRHRVLDSIPIIQKK